MRPQAFIVHVAIAMISSSLLFAQQNFDDIKKKAAADDAKAQNELGVMYRQGDGVTRDREAAVSWYRKAAFQKYPDALYNLGIAYFNGDGVSSDELRAYAFLAIAKDEGSTEASRALEGFARDWRQSKVEAARMTEADIYNHGTEVPENDGRAYMLVREVAESGDAGAEYWTCVYLDIGHGVEKNPTEAFPWCVKAAKQNQPEAMFAIGDKFERGIGTPIDYKQAEYWYRFVAYFKPEAARRIAHLYKSGTLKSNEELLPDAMLQFAQSRGDSVAEKELNADLVQFSDKAKGKLRKVYEQLNNELLRLSHTKP